MESTLLHRCMWSARRVGFCIMILIPAAASLGTHASVAVTLQYGWANPFPDLDGAVSALATRGDTLYVGGYFRTAGGLEVNHVVMWDGMRWSNLGAGVNRSVQSLAIDKNGILYVGGDFTRAGGQPAAFVARWDGQNWSAMGSGMNQFVSALTFDSQGTLYAGGAFTRAGDAETSFIARWQDDAWHPVGAGMNHNVFALAPDDDGRLYAAGGFTVAGQSSAHQVALWDGEEWQSVGEGIHPAMAGHPVFALALHPDGTLYAGGNFDGAGDVESQNLARWEGARWSPVGGSVSGSVHALTVGDDGALYVGGYFTRVGNVSAKHVARWHDGKWSPLSGGTNELVHALAIGQDGMLHVGGSFDLAGPIAASHLVCWVPSVASGTEDPSSPPMWGRVHGVHPNPLDDVATLSYEILVAGSISIQIFDLLGRQRLTVVEGLRAAGVHTSVLDGSSLPSGRYFYQVYAGKNVLGVGTLVRR